MLIIRETAMLRKTLIAFVLVSVGLVGSCTLLVGGGAYRDADSNKEVAALATRELARAWKVSDLRPYFTADAIRHINFDQAQASMNGLKALGSLKRIIDARQTEYRYNVQLGGASSKSATVVLEAEFENGPATVTVKLASDGAVMKVVHIHVHAAGPLRPKQSA